MFYTISLPTIDRALGNLEYVLRKGEANAEERGIDPVVFIRSRLAPDMSDLLGQVEVATSQAKACPHRLTGSTPPVYEDMDETFASLYERIAMARGELAKFSAEDIDPTVMRKFMVPLGTDEREFVGGAYIFGFMLPNIYFHCTTAYNILRHNGVPLGKIDFFGGGNL